MTRETIEKLYKHFCELSEGKVNTNNPVRDELIKSDALKNKIELEAKFSFLKSAKQSKQDTKEETSKKEE